MSSSLSPIDATPVAPAAAPPYRHRRSSPARRAAHGAAPRPRRRSATATPTRFCGGAPVAAGRARQALQVRAMVRPQAGARGGAVHLRHCVFKLAQRQNGVVQLAQRGAQRQLDVERAAACQQLCRGTRSRSCGAGSRSRAAGPSARGSRCAPPSPRTRAPPRQTLCAGAHRRTPCAGCCGASPSTPWSNASLVSLPGYRHIRVNV